MFHILVPSTCRIDKIRYNLYKYKKKEGEELVSSKPITDVAECIKGLSSNLCEGRTKCVSSKI